jgi:putative intracellular protease/amidase
MKKIAAIFCATFALAVAAVADPLRVALYDDAGSAGKGVPRASAILGKRDDVQLTVLKAEAIPGLANEKFDVILFTGGSGSRQSKAIGEAGCAAVKKFVEAGGGYVGICAGAYLACEFSWGVKVLNAKTVSPKWARGHGIVKMELTDAGKKILGEKAGEFDVVYGNGPIIKPANDPALPEYKPLAFFRTEMAEHDTPKGVMIGAPAIAAADCGKGRVLCISPHPEQTDGLDDIVVRAVEWAGRRRN